MTASVSAHTAPSRFTCVQIESTLENAPFVTTRCRSASPPSATTIVSRFLRKS